MNLWTILFIFLPFAQETFTEFTYCRENSRGPFESQCAALDANGAGEIRFKRRGADEVRRAVALSAIGRSRFVNVLSATNFLERSEQYESKRRVANLGQKHLILETPAGRREARFNYSEIKEVNALVAFFDAMLNQEMIAFDLDLAIQYERLSIPERLDQLENEMKANRVADPHRLIDVLERIERDQRIVNYARSHAKKLKDQLSAAK